MMRMAVHLGFALLASACSTRLWTTPAPRPMVLPPGDPLGALVGSWDVEFRVDSARHGTLQPGAVVRGSFTVIDTVFEYGPEGIKGVADFDLPISCFRRGPGVFRVAVQGDTLTIDFTPNARGCGLRAKGRLAGDTVNGRWYESASVGVASTGAFLMIRKERP